MDARKRIIDECAILMANEDMPLDEDWRSFARGAAAAGLMALGGRAMGANTDVRASDMEPAIGHRTGIMMTMPDGTLKDRGFATQDEIDAYHARQGGTGEMSMRHRRNYDTAKRTVVTTGYGDSEESAVRNAIRSAVEQGNGQTVDAKTVVQDGELAEDDIVSSTRGNVEKYRVLDTTDNGDGTCTAKVQVFLGNDMSSKLSDGERRGGSFRGRTHVGMDDLVSDDFSEI